MASNIRERKHDNVTIGKLRKTYPGLAEGVIRSDATLAALKDKIGLPASSSLNDVRKKLKELK